MCRVLRGTATEGDQALRSTRKQAAIEKNERAALLVGCAQAIAWSQGMALVGWSVVWCAGGLWTWSCCRGRGSSGLGLGTRRRGAQWGVQAAVGLGLEEGREARLQGFGRGEMVCSLEICGGSRMMLGHAPWWRISVGRGP